MRSINFSSDRGLAHGACAFHELLGGGHDIASIERNYSPSQLEQHALQAAIVEEQALAGSVSSYLRQFDKQLYADSWFDGFLIAKDRYMANQKLKAQAEAAHGFAPTTIALYRNAVEAADRSAVVRGANPSAAFILLAEAAVEISRHLSGYSFPARDVALLEATREHLLNLAAHGRGNRAGSMPLLTDFPVDTLG